MIFAIIQYKKNNFKLHRLKIEHFHFSSGELYEGMPRSTSIEIFGNYNFNTKKVEWCKNIEHRYVSFSDPHSDDVNQSSEPLDDSVITAIEKIDLRNLKNNYFTEEKPERFTHWEISYNYYSKIVGTYDKK